MAISLNNVSYSYKGRFQTVRAVDGVSYDFEPGRCYAIIGKSGSGKTTLLSLMAGLDLPTEGEILVDGKPTKDWNRNQMRRDVVSVIYQNYNLFPLLTVQENICYPLDLKKMPRKNPQRWPGKSGSGWSCPRPTISVCPASYPAANSSGWPSPEPWPRAAKSSWPTSPPATWTPPTPETSWKSFAAWPMRTAAR